DAQRRRIAPDTVDGRPQYVLPGQPDGTTIYYRFVSTRTGDGLDVSISRDEPFVYFISSDHVGDLDRHDDLLDVFDVARLVSHVVWHEPVPRADRLDSD